MNTFLTVLRSIGILLLGFAAVVLVNLPHDALINRFYPGTAKDNLPLTAPAEFLSLGIVFLAGAAAGLVVSLLGGRHRKTLLLVLTGLFLLIDLQGVLGHLAATSFFYRLAVVGLVPLEVWAGHALAKRIRPESPTWTAPAAS